MTREEMVKRSFKPYMIILYKTRRMEYAIEMMLLAIDFDNETMTLQPIHPDYLQQEYIASIECCFFPKKGLTVVGKKEFKNETIAREVTNETGTKLPSA